MASVRKRTWKTGGAVKTAWVADYFDQAGKRRLKTFDTRKAADAWLVNARHEVSQGIHTPASISLTVGEAGELWFEQSENDGLERSTLMQYRQHLEHHIKPLIGSVKLAELSPAMVQAFRNDLIRGGRSRVMAKKAISSLGAILANAMAAGKVARNVAASKAAKPGDRTGSTSAIRHDCRSGWTSQARTRFAPCCRTHKADGGHWSSRRSLLGCAPASFAGCDGVMSTSTAANLPCTSALTAGGRSAHRNRMPASEPCRWRRWLSAR